MPDSQAPAAAVGYGLSLQSPGSGGSTSAVLRNNVQRPAIVPIDDAPGTPLQDAVTKLGDRFVLWL